MNSEAEQAKLTFWDHLDELRAVLLKAIAVTGLTATMAFFLKDQLFAVILAPKNAQFLTHRLMGGEPFVLQLVNTGLTEQLMTHMRVSLLVGLLIASPYIIYQLFGFVAPGLYQNERRITVRIVLACYAMFLLGAATNYVLIFPLTVRFLGTYQVQAEVANMLTLQSYVDTLISMTFMMGMVFQLPVICAMLGQMGVLSRHLMRHYRRHALVAILTVAAIITPTTDIMTLLVVSLPIWLLYEGSIFLIRN